MKETTRLDWITEAYSAKLERFAAEHEMSQSTVEGSFREHCATFQSLVVDGTSRDVVRELAYRKLHWHPPEAEKSTSG